MANAKADAEWPDGNDVEPGILTCRWPGTPAWARFGRVRNDTGLTPRLTSADVAPMASVPRSAARRPALPPPMARPAAMASQSLDLSAARDSRRSGSSRAGVGVVAIAS